MSLRSPPGIGLIPFLKGFVFLRTCLRCTYAVARGYLLKVLGPLYISSLQLPHRYPFGDSLKTKKELVNVKERKLAESTKTERSEWGKERAQLESDNSEQVKKLEDKHGSHN